MAKLNYEKLSWKQRKQLWADMLWWSKACWALSSDDMRMHYRKTHPRVQRMFRLLWRYVRTNANENKRILADVCARRIHGI